MVIESYIGKSSLIYSRTPLDNTSCVKVFVGNAIVKTINMQRIYDNGYVDIWLNR